MVRGDLEQLCGRAQAMNLVQNDPLAADAGQEAFRIIEHPADAGQLTVEVFHPIQALRERGLAGAAHPGEPNDRTVRPGIFDGLDPIVAPNKVYHVQLH